MGMTLSRDPIGWSAPGRPIAYLARPVLDIRRLSSLVTTLRIAGITTAVPRVCIIRRSVHRRKRISRISTSCPVSGSTAARWCAFTWIMAARRRNNGFKLNRKRTIPSLRRSDLYIYISELVTEKGLTASARCYYLYFFFSFPCDFPFLEIRPIDSPSLMSGQGNPPEAKA